MDRASSGKRQAGRRRRRPGRQGEEREEGDLHAIPRLNALLRQRQRALTPAGCGHLLALLGPRKAGSGRRAPVGEPKSNKSPHGTRPFLPFPFLFLSLRPDSCVRLSLSLSVSGLCCSSLPCALPASLSLRLSLSIQSVEATEEAGEGRPCCGCSHWTAFTPLRCYARSLVVPSTGRKDAAQA